MHGVSKPIVRDQINESNFIHLNSSSKLAFQSKSQSKANAILPFPVRQAGHAVSVTVVQEALRTPAPPVTWLVVRVKKKEKNIKKKKNKQSVIFCHQSLPSFELPQFGFYLFIFLPSPPRINMHLMDFNECEKQKAAWCHILFAMRRICGL